MAQCPSLPIVLVGLMFPLYGTGSNSGIPASRSASGLVGEASEADVSRLRVKAKDGGETNSSSGVCWETQVRTRWSCDSDDVTFRVGMRSPVNDSFFLRDEGERGPDGVTMILGIEQRLSR
ncbi:hypothetical protein PoB_001295200 [Plakobranchus ocellatus]|uniref:Uncharacterized protein n=1 Tax=Plakobranchus ocellatus TaxID=259542 RepID=A0AAV3YU21_9GAST|nr:hypothetical protein PoB_001295200 [Plakobranchus ocellatus]